MTEEVQKHLQGDSDSNPPDGEPAGVYSKFSSSTNMINTNKKMRIHLILVRNVMIIQGNNE